MICRRHLFFFRAFRLKDSPVDGPQCSCCCPSSRAFQVEVGERITCCRTLFHGALLSQVCGSVFLCCCSFLRLFYFLGESLAVTQRGDAPEAFPKVLRCVPPFMCS